MARYARGAVLLGLAVAVLAGTAPGEDKKEEVRTVYVPLNGGKRIQMSGKQRIASIQVGDEKLLEGKVLKGPVDEKDSSKTVYLLGLGLGKSTVTLMDEEGKKEPFEVVVRRELSLPVGVPYRLEMPDGRPVKKAVTSDEKIARVQSVKNDVAAVQIDPKAPGQVRVMLTDADGKTETYEVFVRTVQRMLTVGEKQNLQMTRPKDKNKALNIGEVISDSPRIVRIRPGDRTTVEIEALEPGFCEIVLVSPAQPGEMQPEIVETIHIGVKPKEK